MIDTLEEMHRATMMNPRAAALYAPLCQPGEKLCVGVWDSWVVEIQKPENHHDQRISYSTKIKGNGLSRLECSDLEGKPVFTNLLGASSSPRGTDESLSFYLLELEAVTGLRGGMTGMLVGRPGYTMVHLFDNGFRYMLFYFRYLSWQFACCSSVQVVALCMF